MPRHYRPGRNCSFYEWYATPEERAIVEEQLEPLHRALNKIILDNIDLDAWEKDFQEHCKIAQQLFKPRSRK